MKKGDYLSRDIADIKSLLKKVPEHFDASHVIAAFFGALFFGFTFVMKGLLFRVGLGLQSWNIFMIVIATVLIVSAEIYFIGYRRVENKHERKFGQFWLKRIVVYYVIALIVASLLLYIYGLFSGLLPGDAFRLIIAVSFPAAIGAASADLLRKY
ncbi:hypothetical protein COV18_01275 [Candidatus Woesearchaeota archaeon CG10_big_fil_rev_8_21_14_0_10_37_12]|nr:MAG: hypothetical protein COV18_01275 [Candidatus Woesearchaeota archaeon CG10_big_fil_rev_8_21_14_0_10_37_12]